MILQALYDYYKRCDNLPTFGLEQKEIGFLIVIDRNGNFIRFEDRRINNKEAQVFLVKKHVGRSSAPAANYLYDNAAYVLGVSDKEDADKYYNTFKKGIEEIYLAHPTNDTIKAVRLFYLHEHTAIIESIQQDSLWEDIRKNLNKKYSIFSFLIEGESEIAATNKELLSTPDVTQKEGYSICLVSGEKGRLVETTTATMIQGSQATAKLVSFQIKSGYDSYGKEKGNNAPISEKAEFAYTTALNHMLGTKSKNKFLIGTRTFLFWASRDDEAGKKVEESIFDLFGFNNAEDDPNRKIEQVRIVFRAIYSGALHTSLEDKFYILGLAPNSARIAVVYWAEIPLFEFATRINKHFEDMEVVDTRKERKPYYDLRSIISTVTLGGKVSDATPNLADAVVKSIFEGLPYPQTLYASCIRRIRAESSDKDKNPVNITRAAIIKAHLNRLINNQQNISVMIDKDNNNQGYLCGRLFATFEKIQEEANGQHSIRERYMNAASATPSTVFATIFNLSAHHAENLNEGRRIFFEKLKQEILDKISADGFPAHLDLQDQGRFFVGYYQQRQDFFTGKDKEN